jgi:hypothetical protein
MSRRRLSFTERRKTRLARRFGRLDQLEARTTITEPISLTGLALSSMRGLVQLGIMQADGGNSALLGLAKMAQQATQGLARPRPAAAIAPSSTSIAIGFPSKPAARGAGGSGSVQELTNQVLAASQSQPDWLALTASADLASSQSEGLTTPWHPAARAGGGAALPPRGGSGNGAQAATIALVAGRGGHATVQAPPSAPASIPGYLAPQLPKAAPASRAPAPVVTRNAAAAALTTGGGSASSPLAVNAAAAITPTSPTRVTIAENASSLPSSSIGNSSPGALEEFTYFPLYTLDYN